MDEVAYDFYNALKELYTNPKGFSAKLVSQELIPSRFSEKVMLESMLQPLFYAKTLINCI